MSNGTATGVSPQSARAVRAARVVVHIACLLPLAWLVWTGVYRDLGANPIEYITRFLGDWTLRLLLITLAFTPVAALLRVRIVRYRRAVGLYCLFYAVCHFITYIWLDQFFDWLSIVEDIAKRPFILAGFTAFVLLIPLAATSNAAAVRWLQHRWNQLHRLVYVIAITGLLHYWWLVRADFLKAWIYLAILAALLGYRLWRYAASRSLSRG